MDREKAEQLYLLIKEKERRAALSLNAYQPDSTPDRDQLSFHKSKARFRLAFGGNQSGKSVISAYEAAAWATNKHRWQTDIKGPKQIYVIAPEYRILYVGVYSHLRPDGDSKAMKFLPKELIKSIGPRIPGSTVPLPSYMEVWCEEQKEERAFSTIWFISADGGEGARKKIQAAAIDLAIIDEEVDEEIWQELKMRFLVKNGRCCISCTLVRSEEWLLKLEEQAERGDPRVFMTRLNAWTSKHLSEEAKHDIFSDLSSDIAEIRIYGKSRRSQGLVYPDFSVENIYKHETEFPNGIPPSFKIISANDPGFRVHAVLWCALDDTTKTLYFYRELYNKNETLLATCSEMARLEGYTLDRIENETGFFKRVPKLKPETISTRLIDPAQLRNLEDGRVSIATQMIGYFDTLVIPANNDVHVGVEAVQMLLKRNPVTGRPHILVSDTLTNFLSERSRYKYKRDTSTTNSHRTKIEPLRRDNHLMDVLRYICVHILATSDGWQLPTGIKDVYSDLGWLVSTNMAERLEEQAEQIRRDVYRQCNPYVGSEA